MRVLVTGHKGYIGTAIVPLLTREGIDVVGLDSCLFEDCTCEATDSEPPEIRKDLRDIQPADLAGFDAVVHLAALSNDALGNIDEELTYEVNLKAAVRLAQLAKEAGVQRFLNSSSCSMYGAADKEMVGEDDALDPFTPYARTKVLFDGELSRLCDGRFTTAYLRNGVAYGYSRRLRLDLVLNDFVASAYTTGKIRILSDGTPWRPMVHIEDIGRAVVALLKAPREVIEDQAFNIGSTEENYQVRDLAEIVRQVVPGCEIEYAADARPDKRSFRVDCGKIRRMLADYQPQWNVREGVRQLYEAYRRFGLRQDDLTGSRHHRLRRVKWLIEQGALDKRLRWTRSEAAPPAREAPSRRSTSEAIARLQQIFPAGRGFPSDEGVLENLRTETARLIDCYLNEGRAECDPFADARHREIHCYEQEIGAVLRGRVVLVTGGSGCVGRKMLAALPRFAPERVVCVDIAAEAPAGVAHYRTDIRDAAALLDIFRRERPGIVFHLAAQRNPGLAERTVYDTVTTNVFGTANVIRGCEETGVEVCIFSSTGKASRYLTYEIYAASKKFAEWQFASANRSGRTRYAAARFTHVLDNSLVCEQLESWISAGRPVGVHAPGRMLVAQNGTEAVQLLLNSLLEAKNGRLPLVVVRNLGWPVETLELALYLIRQSGRALPIYFLGVPRGYSEDFFRGQVDWRLQCDVHPLLNVLESPARTDDAAGGMIRTVLEPYDESALRRHLSHLRDAAAEVNGTDAPLREALGRASDELCAGVFEAAPAAEVLNILHWGIGPRSVPAEKRSGPFPPIVPALAHSLAGRVSERVLRDSVLKGSDYEDLLQTLASGGCLPLAFTPRGDKPSLTLALR